MVTNPGHCHKVTNPATVPPRLETVAQKVRPFQRGTWSSCFISKDAWIQDVQSSSEIDRCRKDKDYYLVMRVFLQRKQGHNNPDSFLAKFRPFSSKREIRPIQPLEDCFHSRPSRHSHMALHAMPQESLVRQDYCPKVGK